MSVMDATAWVAIAGIAGTLLAPLLTEKMRRKSVRDEHLIVNRLDVYADLLRVITRFVDNASMRASFPLAEVAEYDDEELNRIVAKARIAASDEVTSLVQQFMTLANNFNRTLVVDVMAHHTQLRKEGKVDDQDAARQRLILSGGADEARELFLRIEAAMRADMR